MRPAPGATSSRLPFVARSDTSPPTWDIQSPVGGPGQCTLAVASRPCASMIGSNPS